MIVSPRRPTFARWRVLASTRYSMLRALEYEYLKDIALKGLVLDVGGGAKADYNRLLNIEGTLESVNIDPGMKPTHLADLNRELPIPSGHYDAVISLNTLEHIYNDLVTIREIHRVLKPGGEAHIIVPFIYRVHGSPYDYHRHTATAWIEMLTGAGFAHTALRIEPLIFGGGLTAAFSLVEFLLPQPVQVILRILVMLLPILKSSPGSPDLALGYYIRSTKPVVQ